MPPAQQELSFHGRTLDIDERHIFKYTSYIDCQLLLTELPLRVRVRLPTGEIKVGYYKSIALQLLRLQTIQDSYSSMTVLALRVQIEGVFGIPLDQIRLGYMEELDMIDSRRLYDYSLVPAAMLTVHLWPVFQPVYHLVLQENTPALMNELRHSMDHERAWAALFMAAFYGYVGARQYSSLIPP